MKTRLPPIANDIACCESRADEIGESPIDLLIARLDERRRILLESSASIDEVKNELVEIATAMAYVHRQILKFERERLLCRN
jgi:hypothetical protein